MHGRKSYFGLHEPGDTYNWAGAKILAPWDMKFLSQDGSCTHRMGISRPCTCTVLPAGWQRGLLLREECLMLAFVGCHASKLRFLYYILQCRPMPSGA